MSMMFGMMHAILRLFMKVGDLVRPKKLWIEAIGIVLETGIYTGNQDMKIMWEDGEIHPWKSENLEVISESR